MGLKKIFLILITILTLGSTSVFANIKSNEIMPFASDYIVDYDVAIGTHANGKISASASLSTLPYVDSISTKIELQEQNGYYWSTVTTFSQTNYNDNFVVASGSYYGTAGKNYRLVCTYKAKEGSVTETRYATSKTVVAYN